MPVFLHNGNLHAFVHIPKCGGTTIERILEDRFGTLGLLNPSYYKDPLPQRWSKTSPQHITWADMEHIIPEAMLDKVFAVVRHPLTRFVSSYNFAARIGKVPAGMGPEEWFEKATWDLSKIPYHADNHLKRQIDLMPEGTVVFRLEDGLDELVDWIDTTFGVSGIGIGSPSNVAPKPTSEDFSERALSASLRSRIEGYYAEDYERFGYDREIDVVPSFQVPRRRARSFSSKIKLKLWLHRIEHRFRRIESSMLMAANKIQDHTPRNRVS